MKLSLSWLKQYVALTASPDEITHALTFLGFEVEGVEHAGLAPIDGLVVGEILSRDKHPNADKLSVCSVRVAPGAEPQQIVCGAHNCDAGYRVLVALAGAVLPGDFKIKPTRIRGVESNGMMCSARELGLGDDHAGLLILQNAPEIGTPAHLALGEGDAVFDVEITPNRPDALCHLGIARELSAWFKLPLKYPEIKFKTPGTDPDGLSLLGGVTVHAEEACPLYTAHVIKGVKIGPSPEWLQRALTAIGLRPINNVVDVTNYVLHESGQPLHAFDAKKIHGSRLVIRFAHEGERIVTLDERERLLAANNLVIADSERALVVAGIMGGADAEVDETTVDLVLESAYFRPSRVRRTSKFLQLSSDSSYRFERGVDVLNVLPAARRAIDLILETAGGRAVGPFHIAGSEPISETEIQLAPDFVRERCGFEISDDDQRDMLNRLELTVTREDEDEDGRKIFTVSIPSWRGDLERPIDLVEEVLRVYGTDRIPATRPVLKSVVSADDPIAVFVRRAGGLLAGRGFVEAVNYTLRSEKELARTTTHTVVAEFRVANPLAEDQSHLRHSLVPGLLETVRFNQARGNFEGMFFETGRTFREDNGSVYEMISAAFVIAQPDSARAWQRREPADFYTVKRIALDLAAVAGVTVRDDLFRAMDPLRSIWQRGHSATAGSFNEGHELRVGLIDLAYTRELVIEGGVLAGVFEILPERLRGVGTIHRYKPISAFPAATRDLALICDEAEPAAKLHAALVKVVRKSLNNAFALEKTELFDVYRGRGVPEEKKSLAFSLTFRAPDRTFTDDEVNKVFSAVQQEMQSAGYAVRR